MKRSGMIFLGVLSLSVAGQERSQAAAQAGPKSGGVLRFGLSRDITNLNPFQRANSINKDVGSLAFECLLTSERNGEIKPALATTWETSKDGLRYTFKLRSGVKFHNGRDMTVEDIIWSMQYAMDPKNAAYGKEAFLSVSSLAAPEPLTLQVVLREPYVPFLASITGFEAFPVVPKGSVLPRRERMNLYPPGTGPFMMADYKPNQLIAFKKFDGYWQKGVPYLDAIDRKSTRLNSSHIQKSRMPSSA